MQETDDWMDFQNILKYGLLQGVLMILPILYPAYSPNVASCISQAQELYSSLNFLLPEKGNRN